MGGYNFNPHTGELYSDNSYRIEQIRRDIERIASECKMKTHDHGNGYEFYIKFNYDNTFKFIRKYDCRDCENYTGSIYDLERCDINEYTDYNKHVPQYVLSVRNKEYVKTQSTPSLLRCPLFQSYDRSIILRLKSLFEELIQLTKQNK
jgi:hypothetical protein